MANEKLSAYSTVVFSTGSVVGLQGGVNVQYGAASFLLPANNLSDLADAGTAQGNLGLGTAAPLAASDDSKTYLASIDGATVVGNFPLFSDVLGTLVDSGISPSNAAKTKVASITSAVTVGNLALFTDTAGTLGQNAAALNNVANASATPGTVHSFLGEITSSATTQTSGTLIGTNGVVNCVGASAGFLYGVQGSVIPTGTLSGTSRTAGIFGQLNISGATINAGLAAPIWGDYGSSAGTLTSQTGLYGIAMTNTTTAVLAGQLYLYGGATNLMLLNTNAGVSGTTYFQAAGTGATSWGYADYAPATEVLQISVNGTTYYIPCKSSNA